MGQLVERSLFKSLLAVVLPLFFFGALIACGVFLFFWLDDPDSLPIKQVKISASFQHFSTAQLEQTIAPYVERGFLKMNLQAVKDKLDSMAWVDAASVTRQWPDKINIEITEQTAMARWGNGGVLNAEGMVFNPDEESIPANLPLISGPVDQNQSIFQNYKAIQQWLDTLHLKVVAVKVSPRRSWELQLNNKVVVILGRTDHTTRIKRFLKIWPTLEKKSGQPVQQIDLRYPNGLAVS